MKKGRKRTQSDVIDALGGNLVGQILFVEKHLNANNSSDAIECFQLFGTVEVYKLYGFVTDNTVLNSCTEVFFDLWDGTKSDPITANQAVLSNANVDSYFFKLREKAEALVIGDNSECCVCEGHESNYAFDQFNITQKATIDTFIRFRYTTTDTPINAKIKVYAAFGPLDGGYMEEV
jgi:hypothetical protein